jgi:hypothetical protein
MELQVKKRQGEFVSASELARLGYCERQVAFDAACGEQPTPERRAARLRGQAAHEAFFRESQRIARGSETKGRCFVATLALGQCSQTRQLRAFRDLYLRRSVVGRWLIAAYYRRSPALCRWMEGRPRVLAAARAILKVAATAAGAAVAWRTGETR